MSVAEQLDEFAASIPHSCIVVLADLSTGLALAAAGDQERAQERVDALALSSKLDRTSEEAQAVYAFFGNFGIEPPECVLSSDNQTTALSVATPNLGDEGICISVGDINVAVGLLGAAEAALTSLLMSSRHQ